MASKITFDTVRKIGAKLPGVEYVTSPRGASLNVAGRMMTCLATNKSAEPNSLVVRIDSDQRDALIAEAPDTYYVTDHYVDYPVVLVRLSQINVEALRDLIQAAWRFVSASATRKRTPTSRKRKYS